MEHLLGLLGSFFAHPLMWYLLFFGQFSPLVYIPDPDPLTGCRRFLCMVVFESDVLMMRCRMRSRIWYDCRMGMSRTFLLPRKL